MHRTTIKSSIVIAIRELVSIVDGTKQDKRCQQRDTHFFLLELSIARNVSLLNAVPTNSRAIRFSLDVRFLFA
jgi:hypothetical protein